MNFLQNLQSKVYYYIRINTGTALWQAFIILVYVVFMALIITGVIL